MKLTCLALLVLCAVAYGKPRKGPSGEVDPNIVNPDTSPEAEQANTLEYSKGKHEGDIDGQKGNKQDRNGLKDVNRLWPQGIVPYKFDRTVSSKMKAKVMEAIADYNKHTCVKWTPRRSEVDYVLINSRDTGCYARLGREGGEQGLNLEEGTPYTGTCMVKGIIIHEMLHTIGFGHEQSRNDRDKYITINWNNINKPEHSQFEKLGADEENNMGFGYDYSSVMHYGPEGFAIDRSVPTIKTKSAADQSKIGQRKGFSVQDIKEVNTLYKCSGKTSKIGGKNGCTDGKGYQTTCPAFVKKYGKNSGACTGQNGVNCKLSCGKC